MVRSLTASLFLLCTTACTDLTAVRDFAALSADTADYRAIVNTYASYPQRRSRYQPFDAGQAQKRASQKEGLLGLQTVVTTYMSTLAKLAADDAVKFDTGPLTQAASKVGLLNAADASTAADLANLVLTAVAGGWRQERVSETIFNANPPLQVLLATLQREVVGMQGEDAQELSAIDFYYTRLALTSRDPAGLASARDWREVREAEVRARAPVEAAYVKAVEQIATGHQYLSDHRNDLSAQETIKQIRAMEANLRTLAKLLKLEV